jgi:E3 ubiquitin-protein ligase HERC2
MGYNNYGELGIPDIIFQVDPIKITFFEEKNLKPIKVCAGGRHTLVLCDNDRIYAFGDNSDGQCTGNEEQVKIPIKIKSFGRNRIIDIFCGYDYSVALTDEGEVYVWGHVDFLNMSGSHFTSNEYKPKIIPYLKDKHISYIGTGFQQLALATSYYESSLVFKHLNS